MMLLVAFMGMLMGLFILLDISPYDFILGLSKVKKPKEKTLALRIKEVTSKKKKKGFKLLLDETKVILKATNKEAKFTMVLLLSFSLMVLGLFVAILMNNLFLLPVLTIGFSLLPFWYVRFTSIRWKKELSGELETALSIITTSYLRSESIITAIEENVDYINPPVQDVFSSFLTQTKLINANIKMALSGLKSKIESEVFHEWVDALIGCQEDKNIKSTLTPIVSKLSDMRIVSAELDYLLYEPIKEYVTMALLLIGNIPLMYFLNKDWYHTLMFTSIGKAVLAICGTVIFISLAAVIRLSRPIEYKR